MPIVYRVGAYVIFWWSGDKDEPIHVHVCKGKPCENATKLWICSNGQIIEANNNSQIPTRELKNIKKHVASLQNDICEQWKKFFGTTSIKYYM